LHLCVAILTSVMSPTTIYTLSLHDALPICEGKAAADALGRWTGGQAGYGARPVPNPGGAGTVLAEHPDEAATLRRMVAWMAEGRSEEHTSELQSRFDLVCRLLLEKKKQPYR